ncbi:unnamed protein product [Euphydryas editha]|uniref:Uncharacterized protein n=1 Tax=Euphydryas editha TaxID=104508 RepID=A0AAU9TPW7_EUPED|nr:unnamed protein product [Euphydryas editha]
MDKDLQLLFDQIKLEMAKQTKDIIAQMDEKLIPLKQELQEMRAENETLKEKLYYLEKHRRTNNIILYGIKESEKSPANLMEIVIKKIKEELNITVEGRDINSLYRIGKNATKNEKGRPILLSLVNNWMKIDIMKNKKKFKDAYASEDYPKEVLD